MLLAFSSLGRILRPARGQREWRALSALRLLALVAIVAAGSLIFHFAVRRETAADVSGAALRVTSVPAGAAVVVDGRRYGVTPAVISVVPGAHRLSVRRNGYTSSAEGVRLAPGQTLDLHEDLWLQTPVTQPLRPALPGASLYDAAFLADGRLALTVVVSPDDERQLWVVDANGGTRRLGPTDMHGPVAVSADGNRVAHVLPRADTTTGKGAVGATVAVWSADDGVQLSERTYALPTVAGEHVTDLDWAPDTTTVFALCQRQLSGGAAQSRLYRIDGATGDPSAASVRRLADLPSEVVPTSARWSPNGTWVVLLTRAERLTSLVLVNTDTDDLVYLADLSRDEATPLSWPPVDWASDGQLLLYTAPDQEQLARSGGLFAAKPAPELFVFAVSTRRTRRIGRVEGLAPAWRSDSRVVALIHPKGKDILQLREVDADGRARDTSIVLSHPGSTFTARWDVAHAQAIVATRDSAAWGGASTTYWLVRFQPEAAR